MSAGTAYTKRYAGGFADLPSQTTAIDSTFLNAVETALLQLLGQAPSADGQVMQWDNANTRYGPALLLNKNIDAAAAISKSKLDFTGANGIVNADVAGAAAIARSKLDFGAGLVNSDIAAAAAIAYSKLSPASFFGGPVTSLPGSPSDGQFCILTDSTTAPTYYWLLVYNATAANWRFVGGSPLYATVDTYESIGTADSTWRNIATDGPTVTVPRAGTYFARAGGVTSAAGSIRNDMYLGIANGDTTPVNPVADQILTQSGYSPEETLSTEAVVTGVSASTTLKVRYKVATGGSTSSQFGRRWISVFPRFVT